MRSLKSMKIDRYDGERVFQGQAVACTRKIKAKHGRHESGENMNMLTLISSHNRPVRKIKINQDKTQMLTDSFQSCRGLEAECNSRGRRLVAPLTGEVPAAAAAKSLQSCPSLCDPIEGSPPGSPVSGILQARTLEWVAISFSNPRK